MKVSIITATYNSASTIKGTLESVANQTYNDIEHIIVDGQSKDSTLEIVNGFPHVSKVISEKDKGIYDAINKGILIASGEIVGVLNSDDFLADSDIIKKIVNQFDVNVEAFIGDVIFVNPTDLSQPVRYYSSAWWRPCLFRWGFMPAHPSFYIRRKYYEAFGVYKLGYKIAADYELLIRMLFVKKVKYKYLPLKVVVMRTGGVSTKNLESRYILNKEIVRACRENGIYTNMFLLSFKYFIKIFEFIIPHRN